MWGIANRVPGPLAINFRLPRKTKEPRVLHTKFTRFYVFAVVEPQRRENEAQPPPNKNATGVRNRFIEYGLLQTPDRFDWNGDGLLQRVSPLSDHLLL